MATIFDFTMFQSQQFLIPFLFVLAVVFGAVNASNVFRNRGVNLLVSVALAFFAASNTSFISFLWSQFGSISIFFIAMFFIIFTLEAFGVRKGQKGKDSSDALVINGAILFLLFSIGYLFIGSFPTLPIVGGGQNLLLLLFVVFMVVIFWFAYKTETPARQK
jgi:hypothetical protein